MEEYILPRGANNEPVVEFEEKVEVLELRDIEKELCLVQSWIRLMPHDKTFMTPLSAEETAALLVRYSMYDSVVQLCDLFNLSKSILFENVALACCKVSLILPSLFFRCISNIENRLHKAASFFCNEVKYYYHLLNENDLLYL